MSKTYENAIDINMDVFTPSIPFQTAKCGCGVWLRKSNVSRGTCDACEDKGWEKRNREIERAKQNANTRKKS